MKKNIRHILEASIILPFFWLLKFLPSDFSSVVGATLGRYLGPLTSAHNLALKNIKIAFPNHKKKQVQKIANGMWGNLGAMVGEFPNINSMSDEEFKHRVKIKGIPIEDGKPVQLISAHFSNFEIASRIFSLTGRKVHIIYRPANNPYIDNLINKLRTSNSGIIPIIKGTNGVKNIVQGFKKNISVGMLVDQKTNTGEDVTFFGKPAKTTILPANLAIKYQVPIYLMHVVRTKGFNFEVNFEGPFQFEKGDLPLKIMNKIHKSFERWIKNNPEQWFWVHNRWGKV